MACSREKFIETAKKYIGYNEADGSWEVIRKGYDEMVDKTDVVSRWGCRKLYFAKQWHWCEAFVSAMAFFAGCTDVVPCEMSCWSVQQMAKKGLNGSKWIPYGSSTRPQIGDLVLFDWSGGHSDTDHVGIVASVSSSGFTTIEGNTQGTGSGDNYLGKVGTRSLNWNNNYVTGFILCNFPKSSESTTPVTPKELTEEEVLKIAKEVIDGKWGNGEDRKKRLTNAGYNYSVIQSVVNQLVKGEKVETVAEYYTVVKGDTLYKIAKANGITLESLILLNPQISNPNLIYAGQKIKVKESVKQSTEVTHKVVKGDKLSEIAKKYGVDIDSIVEKNGLLKEGATLKIK